VHQRPCWSALAATDTEKDLGVEQRVGGIELALQRPRLKHPVDCVRRRKPARPWLLPKNPIERAGALHAGSACGVLEKPLAKPAALCGSLCQQVDRHERALGRPLQSAEDPGDPLQRVRVEAGVAERLPRLVSETQLDPHRTPRVGERQRIALSRFDLAVGGQRRRERGAGTFGRFQPVAQDTLLIGCDQDSHSAPRTLEPAEQEPPSCPRELPGEPTDRVERRVERIGRQQLQLHPRAKSTTGQHKAQRGQRHGDEQGTTEQR
jgi:hypothetical protein